MRPLVALCFLALAALGLAGACAIDPVDLTGKACRTDDACGGQKCVLGICGGNADGGSDGGADAGARPDGGCGVPVPPPTCANPALVWCSGACHAEDAQHCGADCYACPGAAAARCVLSDCDISCASPLVTCGQKGCLAACPAFFPQLVAGEPSGTLPAGYTLGRLRTFDTSTAFGVGSTGSAGFVVHTGNGGEPWDIHFFAWPVFDVEYSDPAHAWAAGQKGRVERYSGGVWSCWTGIPVPSGAELTTILSRAGTLFATDDHGGYWHTTDAALRSWTEELRLSDSKPLRTLSLNPNGSFAVLAGAGHLLLSNDAGATFQEVTTGLPGPTSGYDFFDSARPDKNTVAVAGVATATGKGVLLFSKNAGASFVDLAPAGLSPLHAFALRWDGTAASNVWMAGDKGSIAHCSLDTSGNVVLPCPVKLQDNTAPDYRTLASPSTAVVWLGGNQGALLKTASSGL